MMMSEQPLFGKKPAPPGAEGKDGITQGSDMHHDFAEEYEAYAEESPPAAAPVPEKPVVGRAPWEMEPEPAPQAEMADIWKDDAATPAEVFSLPPAEPVQDAAADIWKTDMPVSEESFSRSQEAEPTRQEHADIWKEDAPDLPENFTPQAEQEEMNTASDHADSDLSSSAMSIMRDDNLELTPDEPLQSGEMHHSEPGTAYDPVPPQEEHNQQEYAQSEYAQEELASQVVERTQPQEYPWEEPAGAAIPQEAEEILSQETGRPDASERVYQMLEPQSEFEPLSDVAAQPWQMHETLQESEAQESVVPEPQGFDASLPERSLEPEEWHKLESADEPESEPEALPEPPASMGPRFKLPPVEESTLPEAEISAPEAYAAEELDESSEPAPSVAAEGEGAYEAAPLGIQQELQAMVAEHQLWLESAGREGRRATFRGDRFRRADFSEIYLPEASFRGADLRGVRFRAANLSRADFAEADLTSADFSQALLDGASFQRAQVEHTNFSAVAAQEADFSQCEGIGVGFGGARLEWAVFREAQLGEADLRRANLTKANLRGAALFRVNAENANFTQADLRDTNLENAKLADAIMLQANFRMANLQGVNMQSADFSQALEVSAEAVNQSVAQEREWLLQESQRLEILKAELLARERQLENAGETAPLRPMGRVLNGLAEATELGAQLQAYGKGFTKMGIIWLVMSFAVLTLVMNVIEGVESIQLSFLEMMILATMMVTPMVLCVMGVVKIMSLARKVKEFSDDLES